MYCVKCGVELADSEKVCPLCGTRVFHPDLPQAQGEPPYPPQEQARPEEVSHTGALFVLTAPYPIRATRSPPSPGRQTSKTSARRSRS